MWFGQVIHKLYLFIQQLGTQIGADWREKWQMWSGRGNILVFYQKIFWYFVYFALIFRLSCFSDKFYHHQSQSVSCQYRGGRGVRPPLYTQLVEKYKSWLSRHCIALYTSDIWPDCQQSCCSAGAAGCWRLSTISLYIINTTLHTAHYTLYWFSILKLRDPQASLHLCSV